MRRRWILTCLICILLSPCSLWIYTNPRPCVPIVTICQSVFQVLLGASSTNHHCIGTTLRGHWVSTYLHLPRLLPSGCPNFPDEKRTRPRLRLKYQASNSIATTCYALSKVGRQKNLNKTTFPRVCFTCIRLVSHISSRHLDPQPFSCAWSTLPSAQSAGSNTSYTSHSVRIFTRHCSIALLV